MTEPQGLGTGLKQWHSPVQLFWAEAGGGHWGSRVLWDVAEGAAVWSVVGEVQCGLLDVAADADVGLGVGDDDVDQQYDYVGDDGDWDHGTPDEAPPHLLT